MVEDFCNQVDKKTEDSHQASINSLVIQGYLRDRISLKDHANYSLQSYYVFLHLENLLSNYKNHPIFKAGLYDLLCDLKRQEAIKQDYEQACLLFDKTECLSRDKLWPE